MNDTADLRLFLLDQDGPEPDDAERARKRRVTLGKQRPDAMTDLSATLTPEAWAVWEAIFAKFAAPGMCNPADAAPCTSGTPTQAQIDNDHRSLAQRQHDALVAVGRIALMSGELGHLNGLPVSVIIRTTLQDLESRAGIGTTGGGTKLPDRRRDPDGRHANHHLAVFDGATGPALELYRTKRVASPAQRIMLIARDGGCTKPCCTVGAYGCQVHHAVTDWANGGNTNVDDMTLACGPTTATSTTTAGRPRDQQPRRMRMDTPTRSGSRPSPDQLLPPPRSTPATTRRRRATDRTTGPKRHNDADSDPGTDTTETPGGPAPPNNQAA